MKTVKGPHAPRPQAKHAFSRADLIITIVVVFLVLLVISPGLADTRYRSQRAGCVDNLRQIGQAVQLWAADHENNNPWTIPPTRGGTRQTRTGNVWREMIVMSNQLATPKILVCPADAARLRTSADNWSNFSNGGFANVTHQNNATSYVIGLHSVFTTPNSLLSSDRNMTTQGQTACAMLVNNAERITASSTAWTDSIHQSSGNLLLNDGRVLETSNSGLKDYLQSLASQSDAVGQLHVVIP
jgi:competence protein ComGC